MPLANTQDVGGLLTVAVEAVQDFSDVSFLGFFKGDKQGFRWRVCRQAKVCRPDLLVSCGTRGEAGALDGMCQFADISRPGVGLQCLRSLSTY